MSGDFRRWLSIAEEAARLSGAFLLQSRDRIKQIRSDLGRDIKIEADKQSEDIIVDYLKKRSELSILSEESGLQKTTAPVDRLTWIIDPLDGSLNYSRGIPFSCVSIALYEGKNPILGVVYDFNRSELFTGLIGVGAWLNHDPVKPSQVDEFSAAVLGTGFPVNTDFSNQSLLRFIGQIQRFRKVRLLGSAALSLCYVACGRIDAYQEENIMFWDVAAGCALVEAAGGEIRMKNLDLPASPVHVMATNGRLQVENIK